MLRIPTLHAPAFRDHAPRDPALQDPAPQDAALQDPALCDPAPRASALHAPLRDPASAPSPVDPARPSGAPGFADWIPSGDTRDPFGVVYVGERTDDADPRPEPSPASSPASTPASSDDPAVPSGTRARPRGLLSWATDPRVGLALHPGLALHALEPDE